ncbi:MAG: ABC transporter permease [Chloroflexi bacterium]|nr:ABC transporter permease [Chloroflexota bacterium]
MRNVWTVASRELNSYFVSPVAYVVGAMFLLVMGLLFSLILSSSMNASLQGSFSNGFFIMILLAPILTMKLLAEEQRMGTLELLLTSPIHDWQVVVGKFLGSLILFAVMLVAPTLYYVLILAVFGKPDYGPILTSYLGLLLLGGAFLSVGVLTSSLTQNQVVAGAVGIVLLLVMWIADAISQIVGGGALGNIFTYLAIPSHYNDFVQGAINTPDLVYPLSVIAVSLFVATQILQTRRWR